MSAIKREWNLARVNNDSTATKNCAGKLTMTDTTAHLVLCLHTLHLDKQKKKILFWLNYHYCLIELFFFFYLLLKTGINKTIFGSNLIASEYDVS